MGCTILGRIGELPEGPRYWQSKNRQCLLIAASSLVTLCQTRNLCLKTWNGATKRKHRFSISMAHTWVEETICADYLWHSSRAFRLLVMVCRSLNEQLPLISIFRKLPVHTGAFAVHLFLLSRRGRMLGRSQHSVTHAHSDGLHDGPCRHSTATF